MVKIVIMSFVFLSFLLTSWSREINSGASWLAFIRSFKAKYQDCIMIQKTPIWSCLKNCSSESFEEIMSNDVIPLTNRIRLVRRRKESPRNVLKRRFDLLEIQFNISSWQERILAKLYNVLATHNLQIDKEECTINSESRGRHRRRNHMLPAMMFGVTALGMVLVPIGFQFLAIIVGKALLMSKLALILASVNGLKRLATSGVNFGLYQIPETHAYYDREDVHQPHLSRKLLSIK